MTAAVEARVSRKRRFTWRLARAVFGLFFKIELHGSLTEGPAVVASNHRSYLDGPLGFWLSPTVRPLARTQGFFLFRLIFWMSDTIVWGRDPLRTAVRELRAGGKLWIAPRGGIGEDYALGELSDGAAKLARLGGASLQPMAIAGSREALAGIRPWRRLPVVIVLGAPINAEHIEDDASVTTQLVEALEPLVQVAVSRMS